MKFPLRFVLILVALIAASFLVLAVACGGDDEEGPAAGETPAAADETPEGPGPGAGELPSIPTYPGASEVSTGTFTGTGAFPIPMLGDEGLAPEDYGTVQYTVYDTSDSPGKVVDFYEKEFKDWKEEWTFSMEQLGQEGEVVVWSKDDGDIAAWMAAIEEEDGKTNVVIAMGARGQ